MKKLITSMTLILGLSMTMLTNVAADTITFVHGNNEQVNIVMQKQNSRKPIIR